MQIKGLWVAPDAPDAFSNRALIGFFMGRSISKCVRCVSASVRSMAKIGMDSEAEIVFRCDFKAAGKAQVRAIMAAASKSKGSGNDFNAHSEKIPKCEPISINKLVDISEFRVSDSVLRERCVSAPSHLMSQLGSIVVTAVSARLNTSRETSL